MKTVSIQEAEENLSQLVDEAANGEPFVIEKAGKPLVTVVAVDEAATPEVTGLKKRRIGFLKGQFFIPEDMDKALDKEIEDLFYGAHD
jgi:prevent-host-death family protein